MGKVFISYLHLKVIIKKLQYFKYLFHIDDTLNHMHHKFAIKDKFEVLTGSFNWTRSASKYNNENIIISNDPELIDKFDTDFKNLWNKMVWFNC